VKKVLKWVAIVLGVLLLIVGGFLGYVAINGVPKYEAQKITLNVDKSPERVAHGRELASHLCMMCHKDPTTGQLTGMQLHDMPPEFGVAFSKNITQHPTKGIGKWTDGDLSFLLRTGIHPHTGMYVPPWMPKFPHMSDYDLNCIIAWLRSDDPAVAASEVENRQSDPTFFAKLLCYVAFKPFDYPTAPIKHPDTTNTVGYGKYLATAAFDCYGCHSPDFATVDPLVPEKTVGFFAGGMEMPDLSKLTIKTANITSDKKFGVGRYTRDEFIQIMTTGFRPNGTPLRYPMSSMRSLGPHAIGSLYDYLMTTPPLQSDIAVSKPAGPWKSKGAELFDKMACTSCHGFNGAGAANLTKADTKYPEDSVLVDVIKTQWKYNPDSYMHTFDGHVSDDDLKILASHVRELCQAAN